jgi:hypothetical protein
MNKECRKQFSHDNKETRDSEEGGYCNVKEEVAYLRVTGTTRGMMVDCVGCFQPQKDLTQTNNFE